jgi:tRNA dimethylallyltransferase
MFVIITGATATGKSGAAVSLAKKIDAVIISADSMQVYTGMDIGTSKITPDEMEGIQHRLIGEISPHEKFSAARFKQMAESAMDDMRASGKKAIIAGGTGLYINSIIRGIAGQYAASPELREYLRKEYLQHGLGHMADMLAAVDPGAPALIDIKNGRRVLRALEQVKSAGMTLAEIRRSAAETVYKDPYKMFVLELPRKTLYERLDIRVEEMLKRGLVGEVKNLLDSGFLPSETAMQAIGYKETALYLNGAVTYGGAVEMIKRATRNYAKRQQTWFSKYKEAVRINVEGLTKEDIAGIIAGHLENI